MQTAAPLLLALTFPGATPLQDSGISGTLHPSNRYSVALPLALTFLSSLANLAVVGPATTKVMRTRKGQEVRDGKKSYDTGPQSAEMMRLNRRFGILHGASSLLNLVGLLATVWYGAYLAERMA